ncbi:amino acid permease [Reyranella sp.]|uniref:amino acid permease n=1 Tax=Reyranella sp. TaxID=1929291 RepID=UPI001220679C|nr:amino acid permease [Reyranella sp.]TAJ82466.1 MAG: amino acid permease [Reyranella sp.]
MSSTGTPYQTVSVDYFARRGLRRYAGVFSLWALGVGAVISGHYSGWNLGLLAGGWGGYALAAAAIAVMYLGLVFCIAEMAAALPHTGGAYSFARASMGPWGGFITGLCENVEYVLTPAVVVSFLATYLAAVFDTPPAWLPLYWIAGYVLFVTLNILGVELSFRVTVIVTLAALACLAVFWASALPVADFSRYALNIGAGPDGKPIELPQGNGPLLPFGLHGALAALPFAVWLFLAIEQLPLAAEEAMQPSRDIPRGIVAGLLTLFVSASLVVWLNASVAPGAFQLASSGEPLLDGFRATFGSGLAKGLALVACVGLISSFHTILFAKGRQIYSLSRAGYFPRFLSITHPRHKTPHVALIAGSVVALTLMLGLWFGMGAEKGAAVIQGMLLNMAVAGAMLSYLLQAVSFLVLRARLPSLTRPYRSPMGVGGAIVTIAIAAVTLVYQLLDPVFVSGVLGVCAWFALGILWFALVGRNRLVLSPEEAFAVKTREKSAEATSVGV